MNEYNSWALIANNLSYISSMQMQIFVREKVVWIGMP